MKNIINIIKTDLKLIFREKMLIFWLVILPIIFIVIFGNQKGQTDVQASLTVLNMDKGDWGRYFSSKLDDEKIKINNVDKKPDKFVRLLVIPADFSEKIMIRKAQELNLVIKEEGSFGATKKVEMKITKAIAEMITELIMSGRLQNFSPGGTKFEDLVNVRSETGKKKSSRIPSGKDHTIPGTLLMFIMMNTLIYGGAILNLERKSGIIPRMMFSSLSVTQLWLSKMSARVILGLIQTIILILTGIFLFNLNLGDPFTALIIVIIFSVSVSALSIFFGSVLNKEEIVIGISILAAQIFAGLGGCWWPIEIVPEAIKKAAMFTPTYWAMDAFHGIIFFNRNFSDIFPNLLILLFFSVFFALLSIKFFKLQD